MVKFIKHDWTNIDRKRKKYKRKGPNCVKCLYNDMCEGIWEEYYRKRGGNSLIPVFDDKFFIVMNELLKIKAREEK